MRRNQVMKSNGLALRSAGEGPLLLLLHGLGSSSLDWQAQIERALDALPARIAALPKYRAYAELLTVVALDYLDFRHSRMEWRRGRDELAGLAAAWDKRPSMVATHPPAG